MGHLLGWGSFEAAFSFFALAGCIFFWSEQLNEKQTQQCMAGCEKLAHRQYSLAQARKKLGGAARTKCLPFFGKDRRRKRPSRVLTARQEAMKPSSSRQGSQPCRAKASPRLPVEPEARAALI